MIGLQLWAGFGEQTLPVHAGSVVLLVAAGRSPEVGGRTAHIVDIALELRLLRQQPGFPQQRVVGTSLYDSSLMKGECAKVAATEAAPAGNQAEAHLLKSRDLCLVARMRPAGIGQLIHCVQLGLRKRIIGRVLHHQLSGRRLCQRLG